MHQNRHFRDIIPLLLLTLLATGAFAQTGQGTLTGQVTDTSGGAIAGVALKVTGDATGVAYATAANEDGLYRVPYLNPGIYTLTFESPGFRKLLRTNVQVRSTETQRVDVAMQVGDVVESIEVAANGTLLELETSATGHLVSAEQLTKLPSPQLKIESMLFYVPGVTSQAGFGHAAGGRSRSFVMANDGVSATTPGTGSVGTGRNVNPSEQNIEEVKVLTTALPAEYGHSGGGVMNITFKSGTNQLHAMAEERYMARPMIHRNWEDALKPTNKFGFHLMSANINGPIVIPKLYNGRNKTFFLWGFQRHHEKSSENNDVDVPSPAMLNGDYSFGGIGDPIYDPASITQLADGSYSRTQFPGNQIPKNRFDPAVNKFLSLNPYTPESNRNNQTFINRTGPHSNLSTDTVYRSYRTNLDNKIDHSFSDKHKVFGRFSDFRNRSFNGRWQVAVNNPIFDANHTPIPLDLTQLVFSDTYTINPTMINQVRLGGTRRKFSRTPESLNGNWASKLGIPNAAPDTMPSFLNSGGGNLFFAFPGGDSAEVNEGISLQENLTKVSGKHTFKMGYELLRTRMNTHVASNPSGAYRFGGTDFPFRPNTGNSFASFLLGGVVQADFTRSLATWLPRWWSHSTYFQDDWKVTRRLTLNLGLRWQYETPYTTKYGQQSQFNPTAIDQLTGKMGALLHPKSPLATKDWNNFQPRVGLAWNFRDKWVFRGGFAVNTLDLWTNSLQENFEEYQASAVIQPPAGNPDVAFYLKNGPPPISFAVAADGSAPFIGTNYSGRNASYYDPKMRMPYVMNWNGSLQYELTPTILLDLSYQGSAGVGLLNRWNINAIPLNVSSDPVRLEAIRRAPSNFTPYTQFGNILNYSNYGHSTFHSGTIKVDKRFSKGLSLASFYTYAKSIDESSGDGGAGGITFYNRALEKGRSDYDVRHRWVTYFTYDLPFGKGKKWLSNSNWLAKGVLGNWSVNGIQTLEQGLPFSFGFTGTGNVFLPGTQRANMAPGKTYADIKLDWDAHGNCRFQIACSDPWANINAFAYPASFTAGQSGRNIQTGPGMLWHQASITKSFPFRERLKGTLRFDVNNPFKRYFYGNPGSTVDFRSPQTFGKITSTQGSFSGQGGRYYMMLVFKLEF